MTGRDGSGLPANLSNLYQSRLTHIATLAVVQIPTRVAWQLLWQNARTASSSSANVPIFAIVANPFHIRCCSRWSFVIVDQYSPSPPQVKPDQPGGWWRLNRKDALNILCKYLRVRSNTHFPDSRRLSRKMCCCCLNPTSCPRGRE